MEFNEDHWPTVTDLGFSGGGMVWGTRGRVREGVPPPAGGAGAWPREIFLQIDVENMHFRGHV
jgi:hypothetical protein